MLQRQERVRLKRQNMPAVAESTAHASLAPNATLDPSTEAAALHAPKADFDFGNIAILPPEPEIGPEGGELDPAVTNRIQAQRGSGAPLESSTQQRMEDAFGHTFGDVRIHVDSDSDTLSRSMGANAFTLGSDIFMSQEATSAGLYGGDHLLAHELTHVVQQRGAGQSGTLTVSAVDDPEERAASAIASEVGAGNRAPTLHATPGAQASVAPVRVQRDGEKGKQSGKTATPKPTLASLSHDVEDLKKQQATMQKQQKAVQLDLEWRAKFGQKMASYKQAVWRITGGIDAANKGFQDAQVAQAQADQMWAQVVGLAASVIFAGGFEWVVGGALGKVGTKLNWAQGRVGDIVEKLENPANALWGGLWTNVRTTMKANENAQEGQVPTITGGGGGAMAYLAQQSEKLEKHAGGIEGAFSTRAVEMKTLTDEEWETFDVDAQAKTYDDLFKDLEAAGKGVEDLRTPEQIATIIECHLWAAWIKDRHTSLIKGISKPWEEDDPKEIERAEKEYERDHPDRLGNFGSEINERLITLGVEAAAGTGLYTHWWERNADGWQEAMMNWARTYNRSVSAK